MDIMEKATELGEMIKNSEQMKVMKEAEAAQANDEDASKLIQEYNLKCMNISRDFHEEKITQEDAVKLSQEAYDELLKNDVIARFIKAKDEFNDFIQKINDILTYYITGKEPGCTHDCCSCDGCH